MGNYTYCRTLKLGWDEVSRLIGGYAGKILNRVVYGTTSREDYDYWGFQADDEPFTAVELGRLVRSVKGGKKMWEEAIPLDSAESFSIGERLSRALLEKALRQSWHHESITGSAL